MEKNKCSVCGKVFCTDVEHIRRDLWGELNPPVVVTEEEKITSSGWATVLVGISGWAAAAAALFAAWFLVNREGWWAGWGLFLSVSLMIFQASWNCTDSKEGFKILRERGIQWGFLAPLLVVILSGGVRLLYPEWSQGEKFTTHRIQVEWVSWQDGQYSSGLRAGYTDPSTKRTVSYVWHRDHQKDLVVRDVPRSKKEWVLVRCGEGKVPTDKYACSVEEIHQH